MSKLTFFVFVSLLVSSCTYYVHTDENQIFNLPLYPLAEWSEPKAANRTFSWEGNEVTVSGKEVIGKLDKEEPDLLNHETDYADDDFWAYTLGNDTLFKLGYKTIFAEEELPDRQFLGIRDDEGHVLLLSAMTEFKDEERMNCPCKYIFTVFTDDERVLK